jgi:hypothetical protein
MKLFLTIGFIFFVIIIRGANADSKDYPKNIKQAPLAEPEVLKEVIKPEETPANGAANQDAKATAPAEAESGKEQLGPRQGLLRDAGRFKVELKTKRKGVDVFLINANHLAPLTEESRVEGQLYVGNKEFELKFWPVPGQKKFFAAWPDKFEPLSAHAGKEVSLVILPTRERIVGAPVIYKIDDLSGKRD